jgi:DNA-sulfur modification-associated
MYKKLQRKTAKGRWTGTKRYIEERIAPGAFVLGAFPAIAIGTVTPLRFVHYADKYPNIGIPRGIGELEFDLSAMSTRVLLDGMARVAGALDLLDERKGDIANSFAFPVTIYAPTERNGRVTVEELGQLFHDFNFLAEPVSKAHALDLDQSNIYLQLVNALGRAPVIVENGGVEHRAASLGKKSTALVAKQVLLRFVLGAIDGPAAQERLRDSGVDGALTRANLLSMRDQVEDYLINIANRMGERFKDHEMLHLTAPGWNALGVVFHDLNFILQHKLSDEQRSAIYDGIANIDWSRWNQDFIGYLGDAAVESGGLEVKRGPGRAQPIDPSTLKEVVDADGRKKLGTIYGGRRATTGLIQYIRLKSGLMAQLQAAAPEVLAQAVAEASAGHALAAE